VNVRELVTNTRSCRRFDQKRPVSLQILRDLADLARMGASAANRQPLKYILINEPQACERVFAHTAWAAYLKDWAGPAEGERPAAWIVILGDRSIATEYWCDHGIAAQNMLLGATEAGMAGCLIGAIKKREELAAKLRLPENLEIILLLALGFPAETRRLEPVGPDGDIKYWRDEDGVHHVPKRALSDIIVSENPSLEQDA